MYKLFILSGASGAGKSTLLNRLVEEGKCNAAVKYSERQRFNTVDDITTVDDIYNPKLQCDIIYDMYGNKYGFSSKKLHNQLLKGNLILITNDKIAIEQLKKEFPNQTVTIYIVSDINKSVLRLIYMKRHGFPSMKSVEIPLTEQLHEAKKMLIQDNVELFIQCLDKINNNIDDIVFQEEEFRLRLDSIRQQDELDFCTYDYTVLNLYSNISSEVHATRSAFEQLLNIINKEMGVTNYKQSSTF